MSTLTYQQVYARPFDDMRRRVPCLERIQEIIGFAPRTTMRQTLEIIINSFRQKNNNI